MKTEDNNKEETEIESTKNGVLQNISGRYFTEQGLKDIKYREYERGIKDALELCELSMSDVNEILTAIIIAKKNTNKSIPGYDRLDKLEVKIEAKFNRILNDR